MKNEPITLTNVEIQKILPHRYPFLLVDKIVDFDAAFAREENPYLAKEGYTSKDGGHPSPLGGLALAQCIPLEWFIEQEASVIE